MNLYQRILTAEFNVALWYDLRMTLFKMCPITPISVYFN